MYLKFEQVQMAAWNPAIHGYNKFNSQYYLLTTPTSDMFIKTSVYVFLTYGVWWLEQELVETNTTNIVNVTLRAMVIMAQQTNKKQDQILVWVL